VSQDFESSCMFWNKGSIVLIEVDMGPGHEGGGHSGAEEEEDELRGLGQLRACREEQVPGVREVPNCSVMKLTNYHGPRQMTL